MARWGFVASWNVILGSALVACASGEDVRLFGNAAYCDGLCDAALRCGFIQAKQSCAKSCEDESALRPTLSDEGGAAFGECVAGLGCGELESEVAFEVCWESSKDEAPLTQSTREFCKGYTERSFECAYGYSTTECERDYRMWGDDVLDRMTGCSALEDCADRDACILTVFP
jgi:hypothetical protein